MAWIQVSFDVAGERQVDRMLDIAGDLSRDMSEPLGQLMDQILASVERQFDTEGMAAAGVRWHRLSDQYGEWKAEHYPGAPLLVRDGGMRQAMLNRVSAVHVGLTEAVYEPVSDIAGYHQAGADWIGPAWGHGAYPHHLPQRKMVDLSEDFKHEAVDRTFARWMAKVLREAQTGAGVPLAA